MIDAGNAATYGAINAAPTISTLTLLSGRHENLAQELKAAVDKVVEANPFLSARVVKKDNRFFLEPGVHKDCFFKVVPPPKECPLIGSLDLKQKLHFLQSLESSFADPGNALFTVKSGCQVFLVELMTFPEPYVCFVIHLSHLVGDAKTKYDIVSQLNAILKGQPLPVKLDWESPARSNFELLPMSLKDRQKVANFGCFGWLGQFFFGPKRENHVTLLSKNQIEKEKEKYGQQPNGKGASFVSSNDVITAALTRAIKNSYVMTIAVNMRNRSGAVSSVPGNVAGNFWQTVVMDHQAATDPKTIREHLPKLEFYKDGEVPCWPFFRGRYSFITNWTSFTCPFDVQGLTLDCHTVHGNFLRGNPTNVAVVFHANKDTMALSHNIPDANMDPSSGLGALTC